MRDELRKLEQIDLYLQGKLDQKQRAEFENEIANNQQLAKEVEIQKELLAAIPTLQVRQSIQKSMKKAKWIKSFKWGISLVLFGSGVAYLLASIHPCDGVKTVNTETTEHRSEAHAECEGYYFEPWNPFQDDEKIESKKMNEPQSVQGPNMEADSILEVDMDSTTTEPSAAHGDDTLDEQHNIFSEEDDVSELKIENDPEKTKEVDFDVSSRKDGINVVKSTGVLRFPGCEKTPYAELYRCNMLYIQKFVSENIIYPTQAQELGLSGIVFVRFDINNKAQVKNITLVKGVDPLLNNEALRVVKSLNTTQYKPLDSDVEPIEINLPMRFDLETATTNPEYKWDRIRKIEVFQAPFRNTNCSLPYSKVECDLSVNQLTTSLASSDISYDYTAKSQCLGVEIEFENGTKGSFQWMPKKGALMDLLNFKKYYVNQPERWHEKIEACTGVSSEAY